MSQVAFSSGSQTCTINTEHFLTAGTPINVSGKFFPMLNLQNLAAGDILLVQIYQITVTGGSSNLIWAWEYNGVQLKTSVPLPITENILTDTDSVRVSIKQTNGTGRVITWHIDRENDSANLASILGTALTETSAGYLAAAFKKLFDIAVPALTVASVNQTGDNYARLGAPAGASVSADVAAVKSDSGAIKTKTDSLTFTVAGMTDANVVDWKGATAPAMTGDAYARLGAPAGLSVSADVAAIKSDTGNLITRLTAARAGYLDNLNVGGVVASQSDIIALNQSASRRIIMTAVGQFERPELGSSTFTIEVRTYDGDGAAVDSDSTPTLTPTGIISGDLSAQLSVATNPATGVYRWTYTVTSSATIEQVRFDVSATISAATFTLTMYSQVVDFVSSTFTSTDRTHIDAIYNKLPSKTYLAASNNSDGDVQMDEATGNFPGSVASVAGNVGGSTGSVVGAVGSVTSPVTVGTNSDKTDYSLAASQPNYAPAKAGDAMTLTSTYDAAKTAAAQTSVNAIPTAPLLAANYTPPDNTGVAAIQAVTDQFRFTVVNQVNANALSGGGTPPTVVQIRQEMDTNSAKMIAIKAKTDLIDTESIVVRPQYDPVTGTLLVYRGDTTTTTISGLAAGLTGATDVTLAVKWAGNDSVALVTLTMVVVSDTSLTFTPGATTFDSLEEGDGLYVYDIQCTLVGGESFSPVRKSPFTLTYDVKRG